MCECDIGTIRHASPTTSARVCACVVRCSLSTMWLFAWMMTKTHATVVPNPCWPVIFWRKRKKRLNSQTASRLSGHRNAHRDKKPKSCQQRSCGLRPDLCLNRGYATPSSPCVDCSRNNAYEKISCADQHSLVGQTSFAWHPSLMSHPAEAPLESHTKAQKLRRR